MRQPFPEVGIGDHGLGPEEENGLRNGLAQLAQTCLETKNRLWRESPLAKTEVGRPAPAHLKTEEIKMLAKSG